MAQRHPSTKIPVHPVLKKLAGSDSGGVVSLQGYVGPSKTEGTVRLYASLDDLTQSVEVPEAEIIHHEETPDTVLPNGAVTIWVRKGSEVVQKVDRLRTSVAGRDVLKRGRLEIRFPKGPGGFQSVCQSVCGVCQSVCGVCQSVCGVCQSVCSASVGGAVKSK